jgi:hypothetical protein
VVAQRRHDPALGELHRVFDFGFGQKRAMQTVVTVAPKFSPSRTPSIR